MRFLYTLIFILIASNSWAFTQSSTSATGSTVTLDVTNFDNNLSGTDVDVQTALETLDEAAGGSGISDIVEDTTPQLGGNLDIQTFNIEGVDSTEFGYVDGVTSDIQTQFDAKAPIADPTFTGEIGIGSVNVSETELGILEGATLSTTELNYVDGVTSAIQTQFGTKEDTLSNEAGLYSALSDVSIFYEPGDTIQTNSSTSLPGTCTVGELYLDTDADTDGSVYACVATNTWKDIDDDGEAGGLANVVEDTTPQLGGNLDIQSFNIEGVDATEFGYVDGVTSDIQTQLNAKEGTLTNEAGLYSALSDVTQFYEAGDTIQTGASATLPGTCTTGELYIDTDADTNGQLYSCVNTDTWKDVDDDGGLSNVVEDTTPQLGGNLDIQAFNIEGVDATEFGYVDGVTSDIQTQINAKYGSGSNVTLGTISAGAAGFTVDADGDVEGKSFTKTRVSGSTDILYVYEDPDNGNNYRALTVDAALGSDITLNLDELNYVATASKTGAYTIGTDDPREPYGGVIYVSSAATITAPAIAAGMSFSVVTIGAIAVSVDVNASDRMYLDGTALDDGDKATNTSTTGDLIQCIYESSAGWYCASGSPDGGHWTDGDA